MAVGSEGGRVAPERPRAGRWVEMGKKEQVPATISR